VKERPNGRVIAKGREGHPGQSDYNVEGGGRSWVTEEIKEFISDKQRVERGGLIL